MGVRRFELDGDDYVVISVPLAPAPDARLTPTEWEVAREVLRGLSNDAIGRARGVSRHTVAAQLRSIFRKLGVGSRRELAAAMAKSPEPL
ncbi:MAG: helix-turn-helix transcriptional regulator [Polyangiaceae bacterium]